MDSEKVFEKVIKKIEKIVASNDADYTQEIVKLTKDKYFSIEANRTQENLYDSDGNIAAEIKGEIYSLEIYYKENNMDIDVCTIHFFKPLSTTDLAHIRSFIFMWC